MVAKAIRKKGANKRVKQELLNSLKGNDEIEDLGLDETANETNGPLKALTIMQRYAEIIITQKKRMMGYVGRATQKV